MGQKHGVDVMQSFQYLLCSYIANCFFFFFFNFRNNFFFFFVPYVTSSLKISADGFVVVSIVVSQ